MESRFQEATDHWAGFASGVIARWSAHAATVAEHLDSGTYSADCAVGDLARTAALAADSGIGLATETLECLAALSGRLNVPVVVDSEPFRLSTRFAGSNDPTTLVLDGALRNCAGTDTLPAGVVTIVPPTLDPGATAFRITVDASGHEAGTYFGVVVATPATAGGTAAPAERVTVWVVVP
jgi:hypothetical protein